MPRRRRRSSGGAASVPEAQGLFDRFGCDAVVIGHRGDAVPGQESVADDVGAHVGAQQHRPAERPGRVDDDRAPGVAVCAAALREREQPYRHALWVEVDPAERALEVLAQRLLTLLRYVQQLARALDEEVDAVRAQPGRKQGSPFAELPLHVGHGLSNLRQANAMVAADHAQQMQLAEVGKRKQVPACVGGFDDTREALALAIALHVIVAEAPGAHRGGGQRQDMRGLARRIGGLVQEGVFSGRVHGSSAGERSGASQCMPAGWSRAHDGRARAMRGALTAAPAPRRPRPANPIPPLRYPESLPVSGRRDEIARAIAANQVVIVCGETGSGKTTQLPKIALGLGRGLGAGGAGLIGHTQPRRIAAASVARRIADELGSPLGEVVGYKVRFHDRVQPGASVKLMTDGILLAETQGDPELRAYDTLIVDEAHERSLNIDFLLGYLKALLPRRPDLKVIVTSATIDAERFARHFDAGHGPAPVIEVSGRLYPVEKRWRPFAERRDYAQADAIADAVDELWAGGAGGDILVFLPGEREIRDAADHLRRHLAQHRLGAATEIVPLFARLSQAEQDRVFAAHTARRIVLATNVAETSLTVPGIRFVIDSGLARVKRYSWRNKVEQLLVEPISQAAAEQRAGRCGRLADGVCIRLYDEADFAARPRFTDPEILRSSLAGVILRMKSLNLGAVEQFPFLESPRARAIADGYALLDELNAIDDDRALTALGRELAKLPLDPRLGRMIIEARARGALAEVLVIASALSVNDVRDRPLEHAQAADAKHKPFDHEKSEFIGTLVLWRWLEEGRGGEGAHRLSNRQQEQRLRDAFISPRRVREWRDIHSQLHTVVAEHGWRLNTAPATYEQIHLAMLAGLLGNVGCKSDDEDWYLGARGIKFWRHPGANLSKKPGRWLIAAELVETTRLYGRGLAAIEPPWIPQVAGHLLKTQLLDPHWEKKAAEVIALERATLYGLVVYRDRRVNFGRVDPAAAREIFIREALVGGDWDSALPFVAHNRRLLAQLAELEHQRRRQDVLVDDELIHAFYDRQLPADVCSGASLERWYRAASKADPKLLQLTRDELMRHEAAGITSAAFPKTIRLGGIDCAAGYLHDPWSLEAEGYSWEAATDLAGRMGSVGSRG